MGEFEKWRRDPIVAIPVLQNRDGFLRGGSTMQRIYQLPTRS
jgi:hypothetical protein